MKLMELYFQAFRALRKHTKDDENSKKLRSAIIHSNHESEIFTTIKYECNIDVDWVENIEEGLRFVEKAINEDRQFIRTEGEVVPIEKVKRVSKSSIDHLSRHSNYITRIQKDRPNDIIPEKLYIVEKLSDYLVYENRFLYLLLTYTKDFVEIRLNKIKDKTTTYQSSISIDKDIEETSRNIKYKLEYSDLYKNDPFLLQKFKEIPLVNRVETVYAITVSLLSTPLMKACAKAPTLKPPVVKTNVLRMNQNFKAALKLYDYLTAYRGEGYEINEVEHVEQPFSNIMDDEIAETIELTSVIGYMSGNDIREMFEKKVALKEQKEEEELDQRIKDEIARLKKRIVELNEDPAEYILKLEKRNAKLEKTSNHLKEEKQKNADLEIKISDLINTRFDLERTINDLNNTISNKDLEMDSMNQKYFDDMTEAEEVHQKEIASLNEEHVLHVEKVQREEDQKREKMLEVFNFEKEEMEDAFEKEKQYMVEKYDLRAQMSNATIMKLEENIGELDSEITSFKSTVEELESNVKQLDDEKNYAHASYLALKKQQGLISDEDNYASKEMFKQLELERKAYNKMFKEQWKKAKQEIKRKAKSQTIQELKDIRNEDNIEN